MSDSINNDWQYRPDFDSDTPPEAILYEFYSEVYRPLLTIRACPELLAEFSTQNQNYINQIVCELLNNCVTRIDTIMNRVHKFLENQKNDTDSTFHTLNIEQERLHLVHGMIDADWQNQPDFDSHIAPQAVLSEFYYEIGKCLLTIRACPRILCDLAAQMNTNTNEIVSSLINNSVERINTIMNRVRKYLENKKGE